MSNNPDHIIYYKYSTISEALSKLGEAGYTIDFNIAENRTKHGWKTDADAVIRVIHRYEGDSDPADESVVYGIETKSGIKGVFVAGFGAGTSANAIVEGLEMPGTE